MIASNAEKSQSRKF